MSGGNEALKQWNTETSLNVQRIFGEARKCSKYDSIRVNQSPQDAVENKQPKGKTTIRSSFILWKHPAQGKEATGISFIFSKGCIGQASVHHGPLGFEVRGSIYFVDIMCGYVHMFICFKMFTPDTQVYLHIYK